MKEWETLRAETLQSQNHRLVAFQVSVTLATALYGAYLTPATQVSNEPFVFQALLLLLLLPFIEMIRGLRFRDYYQACYISDFIRPKLPNVRYTVRNLEVGRVLRDKTSSEKAMKLTYLYLGVVTTVLTVGLTCFSIVTSGKPQPDWSFCLKALVLVIVSGVYLWSVVAQRAEGDWKTAVFTSLRQIAVREIISGDLQPKAFMGKSITDPEAWDAQYGRESDANKTITLKALTVCLTHQPNLATTIDWLRAKWKLPR